MKQGTTWFIRLSHIGAAVFLFIAAATSAAATKYSIQFGGSVGFAYSPNNLSATVGDTIEWSGDFSTHPLSSTATPAGALSWHQETGTVFDYVVAVPGTYNYHCDVHYSIGMVGSFVAAATGVDNAQNSMLPASLQLVQNYPNPFNPGTTIRYGLPRKSTVSLTVFNTLGQQVATLVQGEEEAGYYDVKFDATGLPSGVYFYRLTAGKLVETKKLLLIR